MRAKLSNEQMREAFELLAKANGGRLTAAAALAAAREKSSILARCLPDDFWDDKKYAHKYRLHWFRTQIRSVKLIITVHERKLSTVFYTRDPQCAGRAQGYVSVERLRDDTDLAREALLAEFTRVAAALERACTLALALNLETEIQTLREQVQAIRTRIQPDRPGGSVN